MRLLSENELWVDGIVKAMGTTDNEESHAVTDQKDKFLTFAAQEELLPGLPWHWAFRSQLPPHTPDHHQKNWQTGASQG